jgi:hypothetical protein
LASPVTLMKLAVAVGSISLSLVTWGLNSAEQADAVVGTQEFKSTGPHYGMHIADIEVAHFGAEQGPDLARWLRTHPTAAVLFSIQAPTWSRAAVTGQPGPLAVRSAAWPWGRPDLASDDRKRCDKKSEIVRDTLKLIDLALKQSAPSKAAQRPIVFVDSEDLGPRHHVKPASTWRLRAMQRLTIDHGLMRSAAYQCAFGEAAAQTHGHAPQ